MAKIEIARRYYTAERLADVWECSSDDITHLIELGELKSVPRLAARHGKTGIWIIPYTDPAETFEPIPENVPAHCLAMFEPREDGESNNDVWVRAWKRLRDEGDADPVIPAAEVERYEAEYHGAGEPAAIKTPPPVATPAVARCFAGLHGWDCGAWIRNLGDPAAWMKSAQITRGRQGKTASTWDPTKLALALLQRDTTIPHREISRRFATRPELEHWRDAWQCYADYFEGPTE